MKKLILHYNDICDLVGIASLLQAVESKGYDIKSLTMIVQNGGAIVTIKPRNASEFNVSRETT